jgi:carbohydrate-binding DOMON domain-containing protein
VGGGIEVFDRAGKKIAAYVPAMGDTVNTLGDVESKEITFSLPVDIVGRPSKDWRISVVVGAQDDHGGGGVGEFRTVADKATEWQGGGKDKKSMPNIYEALFLK